MGILSLFVDDGATATITDASVVPFYGAAPVATSTGMHQQGGYPLQFGTVAALRTQIFSLTSNNPQFNSLGLGIVASGTAGDLLATTGTFSGQLQAGNITGNTALRIQNTSLGGSKAWGFFPVTRSGHSDMGIFDIEGGVTRLTVKQGVTFIALGDLVAGVPAFKVSSTTIGVRLGDDSADAPMSASAMTLSATPPTAAASTVAFGGSTRTTIGANGAATALTANPLGYVDINVGGTIAQIPYYNRGA